jgi:phosphoribosylanthranilate isomerase
MKQTIKVCGQTDPEIIKLCIEQGARLIGFIINYPKSPRSISIEKLKSLTKNIPNNVKKVAVMVNPSIEQVKEISNYCNVIQLHGDETEEFIQQIKKETDLEVIKVIKVNNKEDLQTTKQFISADIFLYDTPSMGQASEAFDFDLLKNLKNKNFFLAGKISKDNVKSALRYTYNIDVNSSLETERGIKDPQKIKEFFNQIKSYEN